MRHRSMPVPEGLAGMRVDAGLARLLGLSRTAAAALAEDGGVELDGVVVGKSDRLTPGALLHVRLPEASPRCKTRRLRSRA
ncbi:S4 domain protein [Mycobacterium xenopi 3993]|nr:S4 domain protein [Mycobacterium xenopi 3993]